MIHHAYLIALGIIACVCLLGVLSHKFKDSLPQRVALGMVCIGSIARIIEIQTSLFGSENARYLFVFGVALFGCATTYKFWRQK